MLECPRGFQGCSDPDGTVPVTCSLGKGKAVDMRRALQCFQDADGLEKQVFQHHFQFGGSEGCIQQGKIDRNNAKLEHVAQSQ